MGAPGKLHKPPPAQALPAKGFFAGGKGTGKKARPPFFGGPASGPGPREFPA